MSNLAFSLNMANIQIVFDISTLKMIIFAAKEKKP